MIRLCSRRVGVLLALLLAAMPAIGKMSTQASSKAEFYNGKVVRLADLLDKQGAKLDGDVADAWLGLVTDAGKVYPLVKDESSRMFFKDQTLLNRPMRLTGRLLTDSKFLQVVDVHSYHSGQLHEVFYWCDICSIRALEPGDCACCGAKVELREVPVK